MWLSDGENIFIYFGCRNDFVERSRVIYPEFLCDFSHSLVLSISLSHYCPGTLIA